MTQKSIKIQTQKSRTDNVSDIKHVSWLAINADDIRIVIDAYQGQGTAATPRTDCFLQVVTDKEVFELTPETLIALLRAGVFLAQEYTGFDPINRYKNRQFVVMTDEYRKEAKKANL